MNQITTDFQIRKQRLATLSQLLDTYRDEFLHALQIDLDKPLLESMNSEWVLLSEEVRYAIKHLKSWLQPVKYATPLIIKPARAFVKAEPLGTVLIISPWNYPLYLALAPAIGALASGNTVVLKVSEKAPATAALLEKAIGEFFKADEFRVVNGDAATSAKLLEHRWDKVLFTGSGPTGQKVYEACARTMTPVVLELGGKNPVYISPKYPLKTALKRTFWAKYFNAGQTCVAPDYLLLPHSHFASLKELGPSLLKQMFEHPESLKQSIRLHWQRDRMHRLLEESTSYGDTILCGGMWDRDYLSPTVILVKDPQSPLMKEEIFGPILAVVLIDDASKPEILMSDSPLALYLFSSDDQEIERITHNVTSGSVVINGALSQMTLIQLPFGGVGASGFGRYRGKAGFDTFSNHRTWVKRHQTWEFPVVYQPYPKQLKSLFNTLKYFFRIRF